MTDNNSDYIVHLVEDLERVVEILTEGYVPNFHKEDLSFSTHLDGKFVFGIPMTSFADVKVKELAPLMKEYGSYGVVMSKQWAKNSNQVFQISYVEDNEYLKDISEKIRKKQSLLDEIMYTKKTISEWKGQPYDNSVEKEWRHAIPNSIVEWYDNEESYYRWRTKSKKRPKPTELLKRQAPTFDLKDVVRIIVNSSKEKNLLLEAFKKNLSFGGKPYKLSKDDLSSIGNIIWIYDASNLIKKED